MRLKIILLSILSIVLFSCGSKKSVATTNQNTSTSTITVSNGVKISGGDGSSYKNALIVQAKNSTDGIRSEYLYLDKKYGQRGKDWHFIQQSLSHKEGIPYDVLKIKTANGKTLNVYFNIKSFFGKF